MDKIREKNIVYFLWIKYHFQKRFNKLLKYYNYDCKIEIILNKLSAERKDVYKDYASSLKHLALPPSLPSLPKKF